MRLIVQCSECVGTKVIQLNEPDCASSALIAKQNTSYTGVDFMFKLEMDLSEFLGFDETFSLRIKQE